MFNRYVKLTKREWEKIKTNFNEMIVQNKVQEALIKKQSYEIEKLLKYKEKDDLLFSYETSNKDQKNTIKVLEQELELANDEIKAVRKRLNTERLINNLMVQKLRSEYPYHRLETVSIVDIIA